MIIKFYCCDRCGHVIKGEDSYSLQAFNHDEPDGSFTLCWPCYHTLTNYLNEQCTSDGLPKGLEIMNDFLKKFNSRFSIGDK